MERHKHTPVQVIGLVWVENCIQLCCQDIATELNVINSISNSPDNWQ